jgi:hypothetical protein
VVRLLRLLRLVSLRVNLADDFDFPSLSSFFYVSEAEVMDSPVCPGGMSRSGYRDRWFFECAGKAGLLDLIFPALRHTYIGRAFTKSSTSALSKNLPAQDDSDDHAGRAP